MKKQMVVVVRGRRPIKRRLLGVAVAIALLAWMVNDPAGAASAFRHIFVLLEALANGFSVLATGLSA